MKKRSMNIISESAYLPGTLIESATRDAEKGISVINDIFKAGGLVLSQVCTLSGLEPHTVQNWVKRGFCTSPVSKKYQKKQFCRLIIINMLKDALQIQEITGLLSYINGHLDDESDDMIEDDRLYGYFLKAAEKLVNGSANDTNEAISEATEGYTEPFPGGKKRLTEVLSVMIYAYCSTELKQKAVIKMKSFIE